MDSLAVDEMHPDAVEREVALAHPADLKLQLPYVVLLLPHEEGEQPFELLLVLGGLLGMEVQLYLFEDEKTHGQ